MSKKPLAKAIIRAEEDIKRGDLWLAKNRLSSYLLTVGYDPELLDRLARICRDMHDEFSAGRYWLTSTVEGAEVDRAIETFLKPFRGQANSVVAALPKQVRLPLDRYPEVARERIKRLGLDKVIAFTPKKWATEWEASFLFKAAIIVGGTIAFLAFAGMIYSVGEAVTSLFRD